MIPCSGWRSPTPIRRSRISTAVVSASSLVPYLRRDGLDYTPAVVDLIDVDCQKWVDYATASRGPKRWLYTLEAARVRQLASIVKGRALLNRGQFAAAAAAVAQVSTTFRYETDYSSSAGQNEIWNLNTSIKRYTVADTEANVGLPFVNANDPRVPRVSGGSVFDSGFPITSNRQGIWGQYSPVAIATGIEARLIEAEVALQAGDTTTWLNDLNVLRTNTALYPPIQSGFTRGPTLGNLADPGTFAGRVNSRRESRFKFHSLDTTPLRAV